MQGRTAACVAIALAALPAIATAGEEVVDGEVVDVVPDLLLVRAAGAEQVFEVGADTAMVGVEELDQLLPGDAVRVTWSRERGGVKTAELLEVSAPIGVAGPSGVAIDLLAGMPGGRASGPIVVDLRPSAAFVLGHLPGAISVPVARLDALDRLLPSPAGRKLVFYGERRLTRGIVDAMRRARALGWREVGWLKGGAREWEETGHPLFVAPEAFESGLGGEVHTTLDIRERERALAGTVPGAVSLPRKAWRWQQFANGGPLPVVVLVGERGRDDSLEAAEQLRLWCGGAGAQRAPRVRILEGGWAAWTQGGRRVARGAQVPTAVTWAVPPGEASLDELRAVLAADPGPAGPLVIDVSGDGAAPAWGMNVVVTALRDRLSELPRGRELLLFCRVGRKARIGRAILANSGFRVRFLNGPVL